MLEVVTWRPKISLPSWINFSTQQRSCVRRSYFVNIICTRLEPTLPILIEKNKNHKITLPKGRVVFSSLDVAHKEEPKYQIRNPYESTNAISSTDEKYNDCFLLNSTIPAQTPDDCLQIIQCCNNHTPLDIASQQMLR